jgi:hypothetical protein
VLNNDKYPTRNSKTQVDSDIPQEFLCAINSHVMKDPVRSGTSKIVYERETIELWLSTRGLLFFLLK